MRLVELSLKNIRSYPEAKLSFSEGITLLSGDIGSGKSTVLLAIEFALFGLARGELTGQALLRHGTDLGSVQLTFQVEDTVHTIYRTVKRTKNGIVQDNGWLESRGNRETFTPSELRAKVFELLGYPLQFLGKQKNVLYRFTIYTPQEEMKAILSQSVEERIETVRRVFGIDAYKTIRENIQLTAKELKDREQLHTELLERARQDVLKLQERLERQSSLKEQLSRASEQRTILRELLETKEKAISQKEEALHTVKNELQLLAMKARNRQVLQEEIHRLSQLHERKQERIQQVRQGLEQINAKLGDIAKLVAIPAEKLAEKTLSVRKELEQLSQDEGRLLAIKEQCGQLPEVAGGTVCPTCRQEVPETHVREVGNMLAAKMSAAEKKHEKLTARVVEVKGELSVLERSMEHSRQLQEIQGRKATQEETLSGLLEEESLESVLTKKKQELQEMPHLESNESLTKKSLFVESEVREARMQLQEVRSQIVQIERTLASLEQEQKELEQLSHELLAVQKEESSRTKEKRQDRTVRNWLLDQLTPFTVRVEQQVLQQIHQTFSLAFQDWFSKLVEDDALSARVDGEFTPALEQQGYEADVQYLSGGERTAVSLAYRLALVHTIHELLPHLGTSGVVILDEPTDGFSSEQLARIRDVLNELHMDQILLVSHEQQLEGFVDHIVKIHKTSSGSQITKSF